METDTSDFAWGAILSQLKDNNAWHPVAYISKSLTEPERNYNVHDKELKGIIGSLKAWRQYVEGAKHTVEIWTNHHNLEYFQTGQKLSRQQARWLQFLQRFDYVLIHKPGITNKADGLSRCIDHKEGVEHDNKDQIVLPSEKFLNQPVTGQGHTSEEPMMARTICIKTAEVVILKGDLDPKDAILACNKLDDEVATSLDSIKKNGPQSLSKGLQEWNYEDGLILFRGKIYIPKNNELRKTVTESFHNPAIMGHPGQFKTLEIVQHNFWWPRMSNLIKAFVGGCATCQEIKNITHPTVVPLQPTEIPELLFQYIMVDFIVKLPKSQGFDSILVVTNQATKAMIAEPCNETIDAPGTAKLLIKQVFCKYGVAEKMISDCGPQFVSKVMRLVLESMQVKLALTTAYHPQANGATEHLNQELEQYLQAYCNHNQNDWSQLLPYAKMMHNMWVHLATRKSLFELLHGYKLHWPGQITGNSCIPAAEKRIDELQEARKEAHAATKIVQGAMKVQYNHHRTKSLEWKIGDQVWLKGKNLKTQYPLVKLGPKRFGPFEIVKCIGTTLYQLKLPKTWKIHDIFHAPLLTPYQETVEHGPNFECPAPDLVDREQVYEVKQIFNVQQFGKKKKWQYLVKWKGCPDLENMWEPIANLKGSEEYIEEFHANHPKKLIFSLIKLHPSVAAAL
jgi:hypothetical protein